MATSTITFKTKAFQDYHNDNKANSHLQGVFEYLQSLEQEPSLKEFFQKYCITSYNYYEMKQDELIICNHHFLIRRTLEAQEELSYVNPLSREELQYVLDTLGMEDEGSKSIVYSTDYAHHLIIMAEI